MEYQVKIDFDRASREWRKNKKLEKACNFSYKCWHYSVNKEKYCPKKRNLLIITNVIIENIRDYKKNG